MNRIERMVAEMCPDGAEYRPLGEVGVFIRGNGIQKSDFVDEGVAAVHYGQIHTRFGISTDHAVSKVPAEMARRLRHVEYGDLLIATTSEDDDAVGKATAWLGLDDCVIGGDAYIYRHSLDPKYVSHFFASMEFQTRKKKYLTGTKVRRISDASLSRILIPVPPIEIQREIVDILDSFTRLEAELEAELEVRKVQYSYLRSSILDFEKGLGAHLIEEMNADVRRLSLGDVLEPRFGKRITRSANLGSIYPVFGGGGESFRTDLWNREDDVVISRFAMSENCVRKVFGRFWLLDSGFTFDVVDSNCFDKSFVAQFLLANQSRIFGASTKSAQKNIRIPLFLNIPIDVPPIGVQRRIADVLDHFDALVNDLSSGLPAEIAARRQQYEYYRDRLLTFPEKK